MFTTRTASSLVPLTLRTITRTHATTLWGYDPSIMLARALNQPTLAAKVDALERAVLNGADINAKIPPHDKSLLYVVNSTMCHEPDFWALTVAIVDLGGIPNNEECLRGSLLHDALSFNQPVRKTIEAIVLYPQVGVDVNTLNDNGERPLDLAYKHRSHEAYRSEMIKLLLKQGAVHGDIFQSRPNSNRIISIPAATVAIPLTRARAELGKIRNLTLGYLFKNSQP